MHKDKESELITKLGCRYFLTLDKCVTQHPRLQTSQNFTHAGVLSPQNSFGNQSIESQSLLRNITFMVRYTTNSKVWRDLSSALISSFLGSQVIWDSGYINIQQRCFWLNEATRNTVASSRGLADADRSLRFVRRAQTNPSQPHESANESEGISCKNCSFAAKILFDHIFPYQFMMKRLYCFIIFENSAGNSSHA